MINDSELTEQEEQEISAMLQRVVGDLTEPPLLHMNEAELLATTILRLSRHVLKLEERLIEAAKDS